jgi:hypothetical protein
MVPLLSLPKAPGLTNHQGRLAKERGRPWKKSSFLRISQNGLSGL